MSQDVTDDDMIAEALKGVDLLRLNVAMEVLGATLARAIAQRGGVGDSLRSRDVRIAYQDGWWSVRAEFCSDSGATWYADTIGRSLRSAVDNAFTEIDEWTSEAEKNLETEDDGAAS